jgi:hypothetical protein
MKRQEEKNWIKVSEDGFSIKLSSGIKNIRWVEIEKIDTYKIDLFTTDEIIFEIVLTDTVIKISEEIEGWGNFTDKIEVALSGFDKEWFSKVAYPAFKTNFTTIYQR